MTTATTAAPAVSAAGRLRRLFFMYVGSFVGMIVYFDVAGRTKYSVAGVEHALLAAIAVHSAYLLLAFAKGELKQFDFGLWLLFGGGLLAMVSGSAAGQLAFQHYSPALVPATLGLTALLPPLVGREPFTLYYARRQTPRWQQKLPVFAAINRVVTAYWVVLFFAAAGLAAWAPGDWRFTLLYPNLLLFGVGMVGGAFIPPLYLRLLPPELPEHAEALIMGMPFMFDAEAAGDARAVIQFRVSGSEPGDYFLRVGAGRCQSFEGLAPEPDLTIHTPGDVWRRIARGELDGGSALEQGLYRVEGDLGLLAAFRGWFSGGP